MVKNVFHQYAVKQQATWLALFAILLILIAPLISVSLQHDPMSAMPGMHHQMTMPEYHEMNHRQMANHDMPVQTLPLDHAEACGYCVLLAHVPGFIFFIALLLIGRVLRQRIAPVRQTAKLWHFFPWLYPDTRAPPSFCFSHA
ncbi:DUF2946 domain-containing protein [Kosakonia sp. BK9b]